MTKQKITVWVTYLSEQGKEKGRVVTKGNDREIYYLQKLDGDKYTTIAQSNNPLKFGKKIKCIK